MVFNNWDKNKEKDANNAKNAFALFFHFYNNEYFKVI